MFDTFRANSRSPLISVFIFVFAFFIVWCAFMQVAVIDVYAFGDLIWWLYLLLDITSFILLSAASALGWQVGQEIGERLYYYVNNVMDEASFDDTMASFMSTQMEYNFIALSGVGQLLGNSISDAITDDPSVVLAEFTDSQLQSLYNFINGFLIWDYSQNGGTGSVTLDEMGIEFPLIDNICYDALSVSAGNPIAYFGGSYNFGAVKDFSNAAVISITDEYDFRRDVHVYRGSSHMLPFIDISSGTGIVINGNEYHGNGLFFILDRSHILYFPDCFIGTCSSSFYLYDDTYNFIFGLLGGSRNEKYYLITDGVITYQGNTDDLTAHQTAEYISSSLGLTIDGADPGEAPQLDVPDDKDADGLTPVMFPTNPDSGMPVVVGNSNVQPFIDAGYLTPVEDENDIDVSADLMDIVDPDTPAIDDTAGADVSDGTVSSTPWASFKSWLGGLLDSIISGIKSIPTAISNGWAKFSDWVLDWDIFESKLWGYLSSIPSITEYPGVLSDYYTDKWSWLRGIVNSISTTLSDFWEWVKQQPGVIIDYWTDFFNPEPKYVSFKDLIFTHIPLLNDISDLIASLNISNSQPLVLEFTWYSNFNILNMGEPNKNYYVDFSWYESYRNKIRNLIAVLAYAGGIVGIWCSIKSVFGIHSSGGED